MRSRQLHDHAHVVLDHEQADAEGVPDRGERADQLVGLALVEPGGGLVEQEEERAGGERPGDREPPLLAVRQARRPPPGRAARGRRARGSPS